MVKGFASRLFAVAIVAAVCAAASSSTSAAPLEAYFANPAIVAREMERHYSNRIDRNIAYGQLRCVGSRFEIRCTSPGRVEGSWPIARIEWRLSLLSSIHADFYTVWYAVEGTGGGYAPGERMDVRPGLGNPYVLAETFGLRDWETAAPENPTDGRWPDGTEFGTYADGAWLPEWAKRFRQPTRVARALKAAIDSFPVASGRVPPGFVRAGPHRIKQGRARCWGAPKLIRCSAVARMLRTESGEGSPVPVTVRWRLTKFDAGRSLLEIGVYASRDAPLDRNTLTGPWRKGESIFMPNQLQLAGRYPNDSPIPPGALGLKQY